jgi:predicted Zn-dependent protease
VSFNTWLRCTLLALCLVPGLALADSASEHKKMQAEGLFYDDPELQEYINRVGQRLVANSSRPKGKFTFTVLDNEHINAFAAPGGYIYISRGMLPYLENESELAGVLGHEIAHVTARHHGRQQAAGLTSKVLATAAGVLTGSRDIMDASTMLGAEITSGFGRDMELEADSLGAEFMHRAGYDAEAVLDIIGVLKDQEQYARVKARKTGKPAGTYHGLYASHPRNDKRLQSVVRKAQQLELDTQVENPEVPGEFQRQIEGLSWGPRSTRTENRFYHRKLDFTFAYPAGWRVTSGAQAIVASAPDGSAQLSIKVRRKAGGADAESILRNNAQGDISSAQALEQARISGYTAVVSADGDSRRLAIFQHRGLNYLLEGQADPFAAGDASLQEIIASFRPLVGGERNAALELSIHYIQVPRGATVASLAASARIPDAETQLRLINGLYPRGEPRTGDWFKVIQ